MVPLSNLTRPILSRNQSVSTLTCHPHIKPGKSQMFVGFPTKLSPEYFATQASTRPNGQVAQGQEHGQVHVLSILHAHRMQLRSREICCLRIAEYLVDAPMPLFKNHLLLIHMYFESIAYRGTGPITGFDDCNCPSFAGATGYGIKTLVPCLQGVFANSSQGTNTVRYVTVLLHPVEKSAS